MSCIQHEPSAGKVSPLGEKKASTVALERHCAMVAVGSIAARRSALFMLLLLLLVEVMVTIIREKKYYVPAASLNSKYDAVSK
jgi:hypothetical protein